jgi:hypothetical protein
MDEPEQFTPNQSINDDLNEMLAVFPEPSQSRMRRKIRIDVAALLKLGTDDADAQARHTFREFLVAWQLNRCGFGLEYDQKIGHQTPDWHDHANNLVVEVFTCERGGNPNLQRRVADTITEKVNKYGQLVAANGLHFVVATHGDFISGFDLEDLRQAVKDRQLFVEHPDLSGLLYFAETKVQNIRRANGSIRRKQLYRFTYLPNPQAARPIDLSAACS